MLKMLNNKKGFSYILTCVMILGIVMAVYTSLQYAAVYHIAREQKNETKLKLDSFVTSYPVCACQSRRHMGTGSDDGDVYHCAGNHR